MTAALTLATRTLTLSVWLSDFCRSIISRGAGRESSDCSGLRYTAFLALVRTNTLLAVNTKMVSENS